MLTAIFRFLVVLRHRLTGWHPDYSDPRYYWFYSPGGFSSAEEENAYHAEQEQLEREHDDEPDYPEEVPCRRCGALCQDTGTCSYCDECEEYYEAADLAEQRFLTSENAPDDRWRYDHLGDDNPL